MTTFKQIFKESAKEYILRIKTIFPITEHHYDQLQRYLKKYDLKDISQVYKTIYQDHPLDFDDVVHGEVFMIEAVLGIPASSFILTKDLVSIWNTNEKLLVVKTEYDPLEKENEVINANSEFNHELKAKNFKSGPLMTEDPHYDDVDEIIPGYTMAGNEYNERFKERLSQLALDAPSQTYHLEKSGLFNWLNDKKEEQIDDYENNFNKDIPNAPGVFAQWRAKRLNVTDEEKAINTMVGNYGSFVDTHTHVKTARDPKDGNIFKMIKTNKEIEKVQKQKLNKVEYIGDEKLYK